MLVFPSPQPTRFRHKDTRKCVRMRETQIETCQILNILWKAQGEKEMVEKQLWGNFFLFNFLSLPGSAQV